MEDFGLPILSQLVDCYDICLEQERFVIEFQVKGLFLAYETFQGGIPNVGLDHNLRGYLVQSALVETELYDQIEWVWTAYLKLLGEVTALRADTGLDSERAAETSAPDDFEVDRLRQKLEGMDKAL
ncbi:uncharacterized protein A4U43_C04F20800 [Asparagus officinalis]|uniref:Uncharacterized protein n=1 Tax=Asparagus officinalis TaxID=4686 RepID=A0A5P1F7E4_ASPOF|nr:uncharacterized protein A4U43_C04F20800 [Asparagus officinalis]